MKLRKGKRKQQWELGAKLQVAKMIDAHHQNLDGVYDTCAELAKKMETDSIPLKTLRVVVDLLKNGNKI